MLLSCDVHNARHEEKEGNFVDGPFIDVDKTKPNGELQKLKMANHLLIY